MSEERAGEHSAHSLRPSFREAISRAERQVDSWAIVNDRPTESGLVREVCAIIAEVYMMNPDGPIRISGEWLDGHVVQQVFGELGQMHVVAVLDEYVKLSHDIRNKKAYLRTALYNCVFSLDAHYINLVNQTK